MSTLLSPPTALCTYVLQVHLKHYQKVFAVWKHIYKSWFKTIGLYHLIPSPSLLFPPLLRTWSLYTVQKASWKVLCNKQRKKMPVVWLWNGLSAKCFTFPCGQWNQHFDGQFFFFFLYWSQCVVIFAMIIFHLNHCNKMSKYMTTLIFIKMLLVYIIIPTLKI